MKSTLESKTQLYLKQFLSEKWQNAKKMCRWSPGMAQVVISIHGVDWCYSATHEEQRTTRGCQHWRAMVPRLGGVLLVPRPHPLPPPTSLHRCPALPPPLRMAMARRGRLHRGCPSPGWTPALRPHTPPWPPAVGSPLPGRGERHRRRGARGPRWVRLEMDQAPGPATRRAGFGFTPWTVGRVGGVGDVTPWGVKREPPQGFQTEPCLREARRGPAVLFTPAASHPCGQPNKKKLAEHSSHAADCKCFFSATERGVDG